MIGARGWVVLFCLAIVAVLAGHSVGGVKERAKWNQWNYAHVAWDGKKDRAK